MNRRIGRARLGRHEQGFTLIEVMMAILVFAIGLLGFALLQTTTVRFSQSANYRTQATNLAYDLLDQIRANRIAASSYAGDYAASANNCSTAVVGANIQVAAFRTAWMCRVNKAVGATATARVTQVGNRFTVDIIWNDERWTANGNTPNFSVAAEI